MKKALKSLSTYIFHSNKIFSQLLIFTVAVSIIPITIISFILFNKMSGLVEDALNKSYSQLVIEYTSNINENLLRYENSLQQIQNNTIITQELLDDRSESNPYIKGERVSVEVGKSLLFGKQGEFLNCMIYSTVEDSKIYGSRVSMLEEGRKESWYLNNSGLEEGAFSYLTSGGQERIISLIKGINYVDTQSFNQIYLGVLKLDLNAARLFEPSKKKLAVSYPYDIIVLGGNDNLLYASDHELINGLKEISFEDLNDKEMVSQNNMMLYGDTLDAYGLKTIFIFDRELFVKKRGQLQQSIIIMVVILLGIIALTTYFFTRSFSLRVGRLVTKIKLVEDGNLAVGKEIGGNDEIAILDKQFNTMLVRLNRLIEKNYIHQLEKKEAELRNLQLQINPHFLYNTLETISAMAATNYMFDICDLCERLGAIFRYSLGNNNGDYVTVEKELKHTQNYVFIQQTRFGDKFEVVYNIEKDIMKSQVLRFILQPIVENAITHGLSHQKTKGFLEISIEKRGRDLIITIEDNGAGMTAERLEVLNDYIHDREVALDTPTGIGINNVHQRIKLSCGDEYGISIQSELNKGSCFTIKLPYI